MDYWSKELSFKRKKVKRYVSPGNAFWAKGRASTDVQRHEMFG